MLQFLILLTLGNVFASNKACYFLQDYSECYADCEKYCDWSDGTIKRPPCSDTCQGGCVCSSGYVRQQNGGGYQPCIPESECKSCPANEHFDPCRHHCQEDCSNEPLACVMMCHPGCICNDGYVRNHDHSRCIPIEDCANELIRH
uniref:TIL domain-containing protein n=1 Tax=Isometrus maculatus TaxID=497827 RepID=A0A0U1TZF0_ISOMC|nr:hypothetical protein [Isometrus maculatus]